MAFLTSAFTTAIVIAAVTAAPALFRRHTSQIKAQTKQNGEKYIDLSHFAFWGLYGGGAIFAITGVLVFLFSGDPVAGLFLIGLGLVFLLPTILLQFLDTSVNWTSEYLCGAKSGMRVKKNRILWADVVSAKYHPNHTIQIKDNLGKSVFWTVYHNGWQQIISDLRRYRPDIDTSEFD